MCLDIYLLPCRLRHLWCEMFGNWDLGGKTGPSTCSLISIQLIVLSGNLLGSKVCKNCKTAYGSYYKRLSSPYHLKSKALKATSDNKWYLNFDKDYALGICIQSLLEKQEIEKWKWCIHLNTTVTPAWS